MRGRILAIDFRTPKPDQDSGSACTFLQLQILARNGFAVTFAPENLAREGHYTEALEQLGVRTLSAPEYPSLNSVVDTFAPNSDVVFLCRAPTAAPLFSRIRTVASNARIAFNTVDLHFVRTERQADLLNNNDLRRDARALRAVELDLVTKADATIVVSRFEQDLLARLTPGAPVHHIPIGRPIPWTPAGRGRWRHRIANLPGELGRIARTKVVARTAFEQRRDIVFLGGYEHAPNVDAVQWFVRECWPRLLNAGYRDSLVLAGSNMPPTITSLASDRIKAVGHVAYLADVFNPRRISIAPLRYGGGIKGKVVSSLAHGIPVVATPIAAEGMLLDDEKDVLIAKGAEEIATQILRLYSDPDLWLRLSHNGYESFLQRFSEPMLERNIVGLFDRLVEARRRP